jgi:hypothetical protein
MHAEFWLVCNPVRHVVMSFSAAVNFSFPEYQQYSHVCPVGAVPETELQPVPPTQHAVPVPALRSLTTDESRWTAKALLMLAKAVATAAIWLSSISQILGESIFAEAYVKETILDV